VGLQPDSLRRGSRRPWGAADAAQVGRVPDHVIATRLGRTVEAVRVQRGIATGCVRSSLRDSADRVDDDGVKVRGV
jgi:hypothetical protein